MSNFSPEIQKIRTLGWKQCSLLKLDQENSIKTGIQPNLIYLVLSQTCDLQTPSLEVEPNIEVILCKPIQTHDGNYTKGKNPRKIHIFLFKDKIKEFFECDVKNRLFIPRELLTRVEPDKEYMVEGNTIKQVVDWIIKRYNRFAFPDSFNSRLDRNALKKILKKFPAHIDKVLISLNKDTELPSHQPYSIFLMLLLEEGVHISKHERCHSTLNKLVKEIEMNGDIIVINSDVLTPEGTTMSEFSKYYELDFDHLSYSD